MKPVLSYKNQLLYSRVLALGFLILAMVFLPAGPTLAYVIKQAEAINNFSNCRLAVLTTDNQVQEVACQIGLGVQETKEYLLNQPDIKKVSAIVEYRTVLTPNDTHYPKQQEYLNKIKAPQAWESTRNLPLRPVIAVLDSGVDIDNPDLAPNIWFNPWEVPGDNIDNDRNGFVDDQYGWDFVDNLADPKPKFGKVWNKVAMHHGTIVAGVATAVGNNNLGITGVSWNAKIMPVRVLDSAGIGNTVTVARGIQYAIDNRADIINLSFVGSVSDPILQDAIHRAYLAGILVVAAAGNEQQIGVNMDKQPQYPVCDDGYNGENQVIGVAGLELNDSRALFSNYGSRCIDIAAPATDIFGTLFLSEEQPGFKEAYGGYWSGTSVAAPLVSGALAVLKAAYPRLSPSQLRDILIASGEEIDFANPGLKGQVGRRLNLAAAWRLAGSNAFAVKSPIVVAPGNKGQAEISLLDVSGERLEKFIAYHPRFTQGVNIASGDFDGDGQSDIATVPRAAGGPHVKLFNLKGGVEYQFMAFAEGWRGGLSIAAADFNSDGKTDLVLGVGKGGSNIVRIFDGQGVLLYQFVPYDPSYIGGINVAAGDVNKDGQPEIVVAPQGNSRLPVRVFNKFGNLLEEFYPYPWVFKGGINLAVGDSDGDGKEDIIVAPGQGGGPQVRVFSGQGKLLRQFMAFEKNFRGGVNISIGDVDGDGQNEIVTTPGEGGGPHVRMFNSKNELKSQFFVEPLNFRGGLSVTVLP
ncbi:S8 family serine peptidase [Patescibacteria group bacterium]|nr:S8 family serine peptidase [Patescibacteria group bacterium]